MHHAVLHTLNLILICFFHIDVKVFVKNRDTLAPVQQRFLCGWKMSSQWCGGGEGQNVQGQPGSLFAEGVCSLKASSQAGLPPKSCQILFSRWVFLVCWTFWFCPQFCEQVGRHCCSSSIFSNSRIPTLALEMIFCKLLFPPRLSRLFFFFPSVLRTLPSGAFFLHLVMLVWRPTSTLLAFLTHPRSLVGSREFRSQHRATAGRVQWKEPI